MTARFSFWFVGAICATQLTYFLVSAEPRPDRWKKVGEALEKELPKTAVSHLQIIIDEAIRDKAYPEAIKAIALKAEQEGRTAESASEQKIVLLQAAIAKAPKETIPVLEAILAHWYWDYYLEADWERSTVVEGSSKDLRTWDRARVLVEVDRQLQKALSHEKELETIPIGKGPVLEPVRGPVNVGDEIVVRLEIRTDRAMEYVHLKDGRGSGTEPTNVLSAYRYQGDLDYYESTRDTASHFFLGNLPRGTHILEYSLRAVHKGNYPMGLAEIQCMYAPEFNSHSESIQLTVR